ncbi:MAG: hypothetical protein V4717_14045 [Bacteroidota bacterium]
MKQVLIQFSIAVASLLVLTSCFGQSKDTFSVTGGKWVVCADTSLKNGYECTNPYSGFEFMQDGTYKEYPRTVTDPKQPILSGKWTLNNNVFTIDQDDVPGTKELPKTYNITWVDRNHFYSSNKDGQPGPAMFVYFQRMP